SITYYADTWAYNANGFWAQLQTTTSPSPRTQMAFAFDSRRGRGVLFGGMHRDADQIISIADTWEWDGTTWSRITTNTSPAPSFEPPAGTYDVARGVVVVYDDTGATW